MPTHIHPPIYTHGCVTSSPDPELRLTMSLLRKQQQLRRKACLPLFHSYGITLWKNVVLCDLVHVLLETVIISRADLHILSV